MQILDVLIDPILPVFAILALGFGLGRSGRVTAEHARIINWVATNIFLPILVLGLVANAPIGQFDFLPLLTYGAAEAVLGAFALWLAFRFGLGAREAILLAIGCVFVNNAFLVLPISQFLYGADKVDPIIAVITLDTVVLFTAALFALELTRADRPSPMRALGLIARLPLGQAIVAGLALNLLAVELAEPVQTFLRFNGAAAAPLALLALGIVLADTTVRPDGAVWMFTALKLVALPGLVWAGLWLIAPDGTENGKFLLSAAGPVTTAVFSLALLYDVPTQRIAQILVLTTVMSLVSLALFA